MDRPRRLLCTRNDTRKRCYVWAVRDAKGHLVVSLKDGTRLRYRSRGLYEHRVTGVRFGAERDDAP